MGRSKKHKKKGANSTERETSIHNEAPKQKQNFLRDLNFWFGVIGVVGTVIGILGFGLYLSDKKENAIEKEKAATSGILKTKESTSRPEMIISAGGARFFIPNGALFTEGSDPLVWLTNRNGQIKVSANIRNEKGELIAELRDNEWKLNKDQIFDRNCTDYAIEVREKSGRVVLQVANLGEEIYFAGILRCSNGRTLTVANTEQGPEFEILNPQVTSHLKIEPIFDYPSESHFGSCPGYESLKQREPPLTGKESDHIYMMTKGVDICGSN
jgi:hypothetical protein